LATAPPLPELDFDAMRAEDLLRWAHEEFGARVCLTCSWQKQSSVLVHMVSELGLPIDVVELDTHLFFRESYETRDRLVTRYGLQLIRPEIITVAEQLRRQQQARQATRGWHHTPRPFRVSATATFDAAEAVMASSVTIGLLRPRIGRSRPSSVTRW